MTWLSNHYKRLLAKLHTKALLKELEEHLEYQAWLERALENAKYRHLELLQRLQK